MDYLYICINKLILFTMDQPKVERLLRLMKMLTANVNYTVEDLSTRFNVSVRTIYRYIDTFREAGFVIKSKDTIFRIDKSSPYFKDISHLVHFTEEEAYILKSAIESINETNLLKQNLKKKLYTLYDYKIMAETVTKGRHAENVNKIIEAIEAQKQIKLINYSSGNSNKVSTRVVEPICFTTNYIQIWAFEPASRENKLYNVARIADVEVLTIVWQHKNEHKEGHMDAFRFSSFDCFDVTLKLGVRAAMLLIEEYPLAERDMRQLTKNQWILKTKVCSYEGIGRFVAGLTDDIEIIDTPEFEGFIKRKLRDSLEKISKEALKV